MKSIALAAGIALSAGSTTVALFGMPSATAQSSQRNQAASQLKQSMPRITGIDVKEVDRVEPGAELEFTLWGTPGSAASLHIDGAQHVAALNETTPGVYQGVYIVSNRDRIAPDAHVTGNLRQGNRVGTAVLDEPLQRGAQQQAVASATPQIANFAVTPGRGNEPIGMLHMSLSGTPGGRASVRLPGPDGRRIALDEIRPGEYAANYTLQANDRLDAGQPATARLRVGESVANSTLDRPLEAPRVSQRRADGPACANCGTVLAVNRIEVEGEGGYVGGIGGGVLGAVLGSQIGKGNGRTATQIAGAVGGALAGREVERRVKKREHYEVVVRLNGGGQQTVTSETAPSVKVGDSVRIVDGVLQQQFS